MNLEPHFQLSEHFQAWEFFTHDETPIKDEHLDAMEDLLEFLERARFAANLLHPEAGDIGIKIISGYRHPEYNTKCGGAPNSGHLFTKKGAACDFRFTGGMVTTKKSWKISLDVDKSFPTRPYRLGNYEQSKGTNAWVHVGCDYGVGGTRWFK
ncbi:MAG: hypothetical protein KAJ19_05085 [Gammaproteobacteria bacterium]|nr:hypothetical protein [Gammaproteobacteria bacterium]